MGDTALELPADTADSEAPSRLVGRVSPHLVGLVVSCLIVLVAFSPILVGGRTLSTAGSGRAPGTNGYALSPGQPTPDTSDFRLDPGASAWALEPWAEVTQRAYADGEVPLWNPYQAGGAPHAANMQSAVFDPLLLAVNVHPSPLVWDLSMVAAFVLGAAAAYLFARTLGLRVVPSVVTGAAFSLSGYFFLHSNNHFSRSYVFLPLLFLLVEVVLRSRRFLPVFALAIAVAANIYVGMPEASFFVLGSTSVYALVRLVQERGTTAMRTSVLRLGGAGVVGLLLAAPLLLLFLEYESLSFNIHKPEFARGSEAAPASGFLHWIAPWFAGAPEPPRNWVGAAVVISAFVAVSGRVETKRLHAWFFFTLGALLLVKSYDFRVLEWVGRVPVVKLVVFPAYAVAVASFALAVLAGIGVQVLWSRDLRLRRFLILVACASSVVLAFLIASDRLRVIVEELQTPWLSAVFFGALAIAAVVLASRLGRRWGGVLLAGVILSELAMLVPSDGYPKRAEPYLTPGWMALVRSAQEGEPFSRVFAIDGKLYPNTAGALGLQDIRVLDAMYVDRYVRYVRTFIQPDMFDRFTGEEANPRLQDNPMFDALGVRAVLSATDVEKAPGLRLLGRDLDTRVYENTNAYPRAWVVHEVDVVPSEDDAFAFLESRSRRDEGAFVVNAFDPRREAVVEHTGAITDPTLRALQGGRSECAAGDRERARIERYSANSLTLRVQAACPGLLVLPDTYFPGWRATVNGQEREIYATDGAFRGVTVPEGVSRVEFRYEPRAFPIGIALAVMGLLAFGTVWVVAIWRTGHMPTRRGSVVTDP
jgi:hypothetical protein